MYSPQPPRCYVLRCFRVYVDLNATSRVYHQFTPDTEIIFTYTANGQHPNAKSLQNRFKPAQADIRKILDCTSFIGHGQNRIHITHGSLAPLYFVIEELVKETVDQVVRSISKKVCCCNICIIIFCFW
jgi:hypothetical protein